MEFIVPQQKYEEYQCILRRDFPELDSNDANHNDECHLIQTIRYHEIKKCRINITNSKITA